MRALTPKQITLIEDFAKTAESLGHRGAVALPVSHPLIRAHRWGQLRGAFGLLAYYHDELGNKVVLHADGRTEQQTPPKAGEFILLSAKEVTRLRAGRANALGNPMEASVASGRARCRCCGKLISKGMPCLRGAYDFTGSGSWTSCFLHTACKGEK